MKLTPTKQVISVVVLVTVIAFMASTPGQADNTKQKKPTDNDQTSRPATNNPAIVKPAQIKPNPVPNRPPAPTPQLKTRVTPNGLERITSSGVVRERVERRPDGKHTQHFAPTGRKEWEEVAKPGGTVQKTYYNPGGKVSR